MPASGPPKEAWRNELASLLLRTAVCKSSVLICASALFKSGWILVGYLNIPSNVPELGLISAKVSVVNGYLSTS